MGISYSHKLIPRDAASFRPTPSQLAEFFDGATRCGALSNPRYILLGLNRRRPLSERRFEGAVRDDVLKRLDVLGDDDFIFAAAAEDAPMKLVPLGELKDDANDAYVPWTGPVHRIIKCLVWRQPQRPDGEPVSAGAPSHAKFPVDYESDEYVEVQGAGTACFWIEIEFGKWLFPRRPIRNADLVDPKFLELAGDVFGVRFAQGFEFL